MALLQRCFRSLRAAQFVSLRCFSAATQPPSNAERKPLTPFMIFAGDKRGDLTKANPGVRVPDLGRMLGQMWRNLPDQTKEEYRIRYHDDKEIFDAKKKLQLDSLTEAEKLHLKEAAKVKKNKKLALKKKRLKRELGKPKAADVNPFVLYLQSKTLERGDAPIQQYVRGLSEHWKRMPEDDKQPFVEKARANSLQYRQKLADWEKKMVAQGHTDILSQKAFKRMTTKRIVARPRSAKKTAAVGTVKTRSPSKSTGDTKASKETKKKPVAASLPKKELDDIVAGRKIALAKPKKENVPPSEKGGIRDESKVKNSPEKKQDESDSD